MPATCERREIVVKTAGPGRAAPADPVMARRAADVFDVDEPAGSVL
jgi:hypothetical protein